jgi:hypothetical protein
MLDIVSDMDYLSMRQPNGDPTNMSNYLEEIARHTPPVGIRYTRWVIDYFRTFKVHEGKYHTNTLGMPVQKPGNSGAEMVATCDLAIEQGWKNERNYLDPDMIHEDYRPPESTRQKEYRRSTYAHPRMAQGQRGQSASRRQSTSSGRAFSQSAMGSFSGTQAGGGRTNANQGGQQAARGSTSSSNTGVPLCHNCREEGHFRGECTKPRRR